MACLQVVPADTAVESTMLTKILVVDDNAVIRRFLNTLFKSEADFDVIGEAANGQEAIERAQELHPDVIVLDLSMPVMNGIEAARILKGLMPTVPLIMFSEYGEAMSEKQACSAGISARVSKFAHVSELVEKVRLLCGVSAA
jgi:DNA-binding NarL/FixJ family response regulator